MAEFCKPVWAIGSAFDGKRRSDYHSRSFRSGIDVHDSRTFRKLYSFLSGRTIDTSCLAATVVALVTVTRVLGGTGTLVYFYFPELFIRRQSS